MAVAASCTLARRFPYHEPCHDGLADRQRIEAFWSGNPDPVLHRICAPALKSAWSTLSGPYRTADDVEDVVQEAVSIIIARLRRAEASGNAAAIRMLDIYAYTVARNQALRRMGVRKDQSVGRRALNVALPLDGEVLANVPRSTFPDPFRRLLHLEMLSIAAAAKRKLSAAQQLAVVNRIACHLDNGGPTRGKTRTPDRVRQACRRGDKAIREALHKRGYSIADLR